MILVAMLLLALGGDIDTNCYVNRTTDSNLRTEYPFLDTIRYSRVSLLNLYRKQGDTTARLSSRLRSQQFGVREAIYPVAFWTALCRDKGVSQVYFNIESWSRHDAYAAYAVFRSRDSFWYAAWDNFISVRGGDFLLWRVGDQVMVHYEELSVDTVIQFLKHIDSLYRPMDIRQVQDCAWQGSDCGYSFVSVAYCGKTNMYLLENSFEHLLRQEGRFDELFDYQDIRCKSIGDSAIK